MFKRKIFQVVAVLAASTTLAACCSKLESTLPGDWKVAGFGGQNAGVSFEKNHQVRFVDGDQVLEGRWSVSHGTDVDQLDIQLSTPDGRDTLIPTIAKLNDDGSLELHAGTDLKYRPVDFESSAAYVMTLTRKN
ncbi:MAG TPA: hypothetical protein ENJ84_02315 [Gammaproteobacteria bacterium]|nr:hypothetical protein [Gammaproteobacteria bacterium]